MIQSDRSFACARWASVRSCSPCASGMYCRVQVPVVADLVFLHVGQPGLPVESSLQVVVWAWLCCTNARSVSPGNAAMARTTWASRSCQDTVSSMTP